MANIFWVFLGVTEFSDTTLICFGWPESDCPCASDGGRFKDSFENAMWRKVFVFPPVCQLVGVNTRPTLCTRPGTSGRELSSQRKREQNATERILIYHIYHIHNMLLTPTTTSHHNPTPDLSRADEFKICVTG